MIRFIIGQLQRNGNIKTTTRFVSSPPQKLIRNHNDLKFLPKEEMSAFMAHFPKVIEDATHNDSIQDCQPVQQRLEKFLKYYGPSGKFLRQHVLIYVYKTIENHFRTFDPKNMEQVYKLGWCLELRNSQFMILDDLMDNHEIRRGLTAWHTLDNVGLSAVVDALVVETSMFHLLKKYLSDHPNYTSFLENFFKLDVATSMLLEAETRNFQDFTRQRQFELARLKVPYYILGQPFHLATLLANKGIHMNDMSKKVFEYLGYLYTLQNDMLDCFGEDFGGKPGTDIQEKKCGTPLILALDKASPEQRKILEACYGMKDDSKIKEVKKIYEELDIVGEYYKLEKVLHNKLFEEIENVPDDFTRSVLQKLAHVYTYGEVGTSHV